MIGWQLGAFVTGDGGRTWRQDDANQHPQIHADLHAIRFDPSDRSGRSFLIASDGGVCATFDAGSSYESNYNASLTNLQFYTTDGRRQWAGTLGVSYAIAGLVAGGLQDNGNQVAFLDPDRGPTPWTAVDAGDGGVVTFVRSGVLLRNVGLQPSPQPLKYSEFQADTGGWVDRGIIPITVNKPGATGGEAGLLNAGVAIVNQPIDRDVFGARVEAIGYVGADVFALFNPTGIESWRWEFVGSLPAGTSITAAGSATSEQIFLGTFSGQIFRMNRNGAVDTSADRRHRPAVAHQPALRAQRHLHVSRCTTRRSTRRRVAGGSCGSTPTGHGAVPADSSDGTPMPDEVYYAIDADWTRTPPTLFAATDSTVLSSLDLGNTWTADSAGLPARTHCADLRYVLRPDGRGGAIPVDLRTIPLAIVALTFGSSNRARRSARPGSSSGWRPVPLRT